MHKEEAFQRPPRDGRDREASRRPLLMAYNSQRAEQRAKFARRLFSPRRKVTECGETACIRCHPAENSGRAAAGRNARKVRRNVETTRSRCIFIPDGADAADESGYVGSLLPSFVSPPYPRRSLTAAATPSLDCFPALARPSHLPFSSFPLLTAVIFSASLPLSQPQSQFYFGPSEVYSGTLAYDQMP